MDDNYIGDSILNSRGDLHALAYDLVMFSTQAPGSLAITVDDICEEYGFTEQQLVQITTLPQFRAILKSVREDVEKLGPNAGVELRMRGMAMAMTERIFADAMGGGLDTGDKLKFWAKLVQFSNLDPATNGKNKGSNTGAVSGPSVIINIPAGIPGIGTTQPIKVEAIQDLGEHYE